ncbi:uncharacterized protein [Argopecten irradians]|uniref:uncharacterized protein n=1 Tax=Argopecten irradians TaxID=31199 RepID=UPI0037141D55
MCPLPHLPSKLKRKSRFKATLRHFYSDFAAYYLLVDKIKDTHARCASSLDQKVVLPMCDILCLSFKHMKSKKKAKQIANKLDKKYGDFAVTDNNTCQIFQPVTILETLTAYVQNALPKLMDKKQNRRSKRKTKSMSKRRKRKQKRKRGPGRRNKKRKTGKNKSGRRRA